MTDSRTSSESPDTPLPGLQMRFRRRKWGHLYMDPELTVASRCKTRHNLVGSSPRRYSWYENVDDRSHENVDLKWRLPVGRGPT